MQAYFLDERRSVGPKKLKDDGLRDTILVHLASLVVLNEFIRGVTKPTN